MHNPVLCCRDCVSPVFSLATHTVISLRDWTVLFMRDRVRPPFFSLVTRNSPFGLGFNLFRLQWLCAGGLTGVAWTWVFLVFGWFHFWRRHVAAAFSALWAWSLPVFACVYSWCVLVTCVYASTEKVFWLLFFQSHALVVIRLEICLLFGFIWWDAPPGQRFHRRCESCNTKKQKRRKSGALALGEELDIEDVWE